MAEQETVDKNLLYSLIPLEDFKAVLGVDDRDDKLARLKFHVTDVRDIDV